MGTNRTWLVLVAAVILAAGIIGGALIISSGSGDSQTAAAAPPAEPEVPQTPSAAPPTSWPPPLPPGVPITGEHAWRATWTPDADAEEQYRADLANALDTDFYVPHRDQLVTFGYNICADYYRGVSGEDEYDNIISVLVGDASYKPSITDVQVREGAAALDAVTIEMAANHRFCMNIDPWGESY